MEYPEGKLIDKVGVGDKTGNNFELLFSVSVEIISIGFDLL
jgi:hypothetical protein